MLIYNYQKEFIGIDQHDLEALGFSDLMQLRSEAGDFADLFVKTPGYIPNFKDVHWIDFITCSGSSEDSKVIIHANGKNFKAILDIKTAYLVDNPSEKAYLINLVNLRELTHDESDRIAGDLLERPTPKASTEPATIFNTPDFSDKFETTAIEEPKKESSEEFELTIDPYEHEIPKEEPKKEPIDAFDAKSEIIEDVYEKTIADEALDLDIEDDFVEEIVSKPEKETKIKAVPEPVVETIEEPVSIPVVEPAEEVVAEDDEDPDFDNSYIFDPKVASSELGLPVELIEEFIQDFITQANDFKEQLYSSLDKGDIDNVKILSHKLKGVAANLRIEDAFETLVTINTSNDMDILKTNLNRLYKIIVKLSSSKPQEAPVVPEKTEITEKENDDFILDFKDDFDFKKEDIAAEVEETPSNTPQNDEFAIDIHDDFNTDTNEVVNDKDVPDKIDVLELADDSFLNEETIPSPENSVQTEDTIDDFVYEDENLELEAPQVDEQKIEIEYNKDQVANEIGLDRETFNELFNEYMNDSKMKYDNINSAIEQNNPDMWKTNAVRLKGMSDNMRIHDFLNELDTLITTQDSEVAQKNNDIIISKLAQISNLEG